jgi:hypothetical protein
MKTKEAILYVLNSARFITDAYLSDLSDSDILLRPTPEAHHIAWQLGHLLVSEAMMANAVQPGTGVVFPAGFELNHGKEAEYASETSEKFLSLAGYRDLRLKQRQRVLDLVSLISEEDLALPGPEKMRAYAPTKGAILLAIGTHELMHSGQWAVTRRLLGKPVLV